MASANIIALLAGLASIVSAGPMTDRAANLGPLSLLEQIKVPEGWSSTGNTHPDTMLRMQIGLKQSNVKGLEQKLLDISNPSSPNYGKWLTKEQIDAYVKPDDKSVNVVKDWLASHGIKDVTHSAVDWIEVKVPVSTAEKLLNTKYSTYKDSKSGVELPRAIEYSLPASLHQHIDTVQPTTSFLRDMDLKSSANTTAPTATGHVARATCQQGIMTPGCIQSYYNVDYTGQGRSLLGVSAFTGYAASHSDASAYLNYYAPYAGNTDFGEISLGGGNNNANNLLEGNLDTQIALALGYPAQVNLYMVGDNNNFGDQLLDLTNYLNTNSNPPTSISTSYGIEERDISNNYMGRICNEFMKAGSRGISAFVSSGDYGVGGNNSPSCPNGYLTLFPGSCPYITSVGGTGYRNGNEVAAEFQFNTGPGKSGGGFSWYFNTPSYQSSDTNSYINNHLDSSWNGYYNARGRGYPDVSLLAENWNIVVNGQGSYVSGTSASSPAWASLISQINDYRISLGKSTLGFINPFLYSSAGKAALRDVTSGYNPGCGINGFPATQGWDPVTGLGSLDFAKFRQAAARL
ncbi:hypothetical protein VHEMI01984 [[Torrubiella] hemipterigena]|uniref:Peptidase S53 domain-containing protein n=1 Tax=[Torrubiella] hemipterigena TaxID=1531966 RepID=A0A0A1T6D9_9HYPO|nr:hypothetical protein VHEMI01984 [[Torrubiella] hemipterigena]